MASIEGKKIVVIGGNGTLGSAAVEAAAAAGADVTILSRRATAPEGVAAVRGSITNPAALQEALRGAAGIVISVEASRSPEQLRAVYVEGTRNVLDAAPKDAHVIFMSHIGITEIERMPDYNGAKLDAEELIRASGRPYTIVRPAWIVSGGQRGIKLEQGDRYTGRRDDISHAELGNTILAAFEHQDARGTTFELYGGGRIGIDWDSAFAALRSDLREPTQR
jgi:uncharacterized protein YbjT (DUF2867 family)